jgi:hypothetical protein
MVVANSKLLEIANNFAKRFKAKPFQPTVIIDDDNDNS